MVGILGLIQLQMIAIRSNSASRNFAEAVAAAQEKIESLQTAPIATLVAGIVTDTPNTGNTAAQNSIYSRITTISTNLTTVKIQVQVTWNDAYVAGKTHSVTLYEVRNL